MDISNWQREFHGLLTIERPVAQAPSSGGRVPVPAHGPVSLQRSVAPRRPGNGGLYKIDDDRSILCCFPMIRPPNVSLTCRRARPSHPRCGNRASTYARELVFGQEKEEINHMPRVDPWNRLRTVRGSLRRDTDRHVFKWALANHDAAHCDERSSSKTKFLRTQQRCITTSRPVCSLPSSGTRMRAAAGHSTAKPAAFPPVASSTSNSHVACIELMRSHPSLRYRR